MSTQDGRKVHDLLKKRGFSKEMPDRLWVIAKAVQNQRRILTERHLDLMAQHYAEVGKDVESSTIADLMSGEWVSLAKDLESDDSRQVPIKVFPGTSHLKFVSADNPYGWSNEGIQGDVILRMFRNDADNNNPEKWNPFRQCYNLSLAQKREQAAPDFRRRGCSRIEVLGGITIPPGWRPGMPVDYDADIKTPKTFYDAEEVMVAMAEIERERREGMTK